MDDPQGKLRTPQAKSRGRWIAGALIVGLCLGFAISQEYYLKTYARGGDAIVPAWATRRQSRETGGTAQPNKELRRILKRIAPKKEVMIAISNANLLKEQTLATWLKVGPGVGGASADGAMLAGDRCKGGRWGGPVRLRQTHCWSGG